MVLRGEPFGIAIQTYSSLTIGDGLLAQIPSLFTSVATGLLVSRSVSQQSLETDIFSQFAQSATAFYVGGGTMLIMGILPGFPWYIMVPLGASLLFAGRRLGTLNKKKTSADSGDAKKQKQTTGGSPSDVPPVVPLDPLSLEIGFALIPLVDQAKGAELLERVTSIRREAAVDMGLVVPRVRIIDNMRLDPHEYCVKIKGVEVAKSKIRMGWYLCMNMGAVTEEVPGEKTVEPTFGIPAIWITEENRERAERAGYTVVDTPTIIATHLNQIIKTHAAEILGRQDVQRVLDDLKEKYPAVVDGVLAIGKDSFTLGEIQKVLQGLLREQVSIRNNVAILETLADFAQITHHPSILIEKARQRLGRQICLQYVDDKQMLHAVTIAQDFQKKLLAARVDLQGRGWGAALDPSTHNAWIKAASSIMAQMQDAGFVPVILCQEELRPLVRSITERDMPKIVVLSIPEIPSDIKIEIVGEIEVG
jgi:flagellar biosynthesis protein FlhA